VSEKPGKFYSDARKLRTFLLIVMPVSKICDVNGKLPRCQQLNVNELSVECRFNVRVIQIDRLS